jgi:hypothetical protein
MVRNIMRPFGPIRWERARARAGCSWGLQFSDGHAHNISTMVLPLRTTTGYGTCAGTAVCRRNTNQEDTMTDTDWKQQLAFLDNDEQDWFDTITDKELTVRLLLAIMWQANRSDCPDNREAWQEWGHADQSNLFGDIYKALQRLGIDDPCEGVDGYGRFEFSNQ